MKHAASLPRLILCLGIVAGLSMLAAVAHGQRPPEPLLGSGPFNYHTLVADFSVDVITKGLVHPWGMAFLPDGSILVTGGIWNGHALTKVHDIFVDDNVQDDSIGPINMGSDLRIVFGRDGKLYLGTGAPNAPANAGKYAHARGGRAQDPTSDGGKILRLNDDGTVPGDNPFVGKPGYRPEIYTMGHRNILGMAVDPFTGGIWEVENGPQDDDKLIILKAGANYGWPIVGVGYDYSGDHIGGPMALGDPSAVSPGYLNGLLPGIERPFLIWVPAVAPSGLAFYTGNAFPKWQGSIFVGSLKYRRLERLVLNERGGPIRREHLLEDLKQRIRDVRQGPDGALYILTDEDQGALLRIAPVQTHRSLSAAPDRTRDCAKSQ